MNHVYLTFHRIQQEIPWCFLSATMLSFWVFKGWIREGIPDDASLPLAGSEIGLKEYLTNFPTKQHFTTFLMLKWCEHSITDSQFWAHFYGGSINGGTIAGWFTMEHPENKKKTIPCASVAKPRLARRLFATA